ncbi:MAG TPA: ribonuclease III [Beijerinckiaceae bacterium]|jgi:ribonuclease-3
MPRRKPADIGALEARIGHAFRDPDLLANALTHMSAAKGVQARSYQRMEFLGDRVLGLAVSDMLYAAFLQGSEGDLSRRFSELVSGKTCAEVAEAWGVGPYVRTGGKGSEVRQNRSVLADVCEAVIAAVFLDGGYPAARAVVEKAFGPRIEALKTMPPANPKAVVQEWALARGLALPAYTVVEQIGPDHAPQFRIALTVEGLEPAEGLGPSKRVAEQDAAEKLLARENLLERPAEPGSKKPAKLPAAEAAGAEAEAQHDDVRADL